MDSLEIYASQSSRADSVTVEPEIAQRSFLFLQGPISPFFDRLARALIARGHRVHRVNFHFGDQLFWRLPATNFRGRFAEWRACVADLLERHEVTDLVLHGDRRPYHLVAAEEARARGIAVLATDLGYVRPDWLTLEYDGMTSYSRFPRDPAAIRALAAEFPEPPLEPRFQTPFWIIALGDIAYNLGLVFGRPLFPHYRYHSVCHPFREYVGWIKSRPMKLLTAGETATAKQRLLQQPGSYFLVPLQLSTDFQIRAHSPFDDLRQAIEAVLASFARSNSARRLVFIVHPLDNGLDDWHRLIARLSAWHGVSDRVMTLHGGTPTALVRNAAGVVTVNSTVGLAALWMEVPVKALGNAIFDIPGLACQASLDAFWQNPPRPEPELLAAFLRALIGTTQIKGGYYERSSQKCAIAGFVERLERRPYPLPPLDAAQWPASAPRRPSKTIAVGGVSDGIGIALARAFARPGVRLWLFGGARTALAQAAADCRQRGALADTCMTTEMARVSADQLSDLAMLVVNGDAAADEDDIAAAMNAVAALAAAMRRRGSGTVVLVAGMNGARRVRHNWHAYAHALRQRLQRDGVALRFVHPGKLATTAAGAFRAPLIAAAGADRIAELAAGATRRNNVAVVGATAVAARSLRLLLSRMRRKLSGSAVAGREIAETIDDAPLVRGSASGD